MKLTDREIVETLEKGDCIKRKCWSSYPSPFVKCSVIKDIRAHYYDNGTKKWKTTSLTVYDLKAEDWEVIS